ncbi:MAG: glutathione S-transferase N-terminal domain-containing protein [Gammaproteobacteria bacterium]|nr:glutathione S-transferase N-terminal domain-containing protein [Gammaproteobacteria bacterium]
MKLHWSPKSPFVRKVMIALHEANQLNEVELIRSVVAMNQPPNPDVLSDNPLGKIPTLITSDGKALYDSRVICEYLDTHFNVGLYPSDTERRMRHLLWQALADGLTENLLLWRIELLRESGPCNAITDSWAKKINAAMHKLNNEANDVAEESFGIGHIAIVCALGQLDFRWSDCMWRTHFPQLALLNKKLSGRESIIATPVVNDHDASDNDVTQGVLRFRS